MLIVITESPDRVINLWNSFPPRVVGTSPLELFKERLDNDLDNEGLLPWAEG